MTEDGGGSGNGTAPGRRSGLDLWSTVVGALLAAGIAVVSAFVSNYLQTDSSAKLSRAEYLRTQRQMAYLQVIADGRSLRDAVLIVGQDAATLIYGPKAEAVAAKDSARIKQGVDKLVLDGYSVRLIGANKAVASVQALQDAAKATQTEIQTYIDAQRSDHQQSDLENAPAEFDQTVTKSLEHFAAQARAELTAP